MRKSKIISRDIAGAASRCIPVAPAKSYEPPVKTEAEKLYDLIYNESVKGYRFTDNELGMPWIEQKDIEDRGDGVFVVRFRCPIGYVHEVHFYAMAEEVCKAIGSPMRFIHQVKREHGIPFEDCAWILQPDFNS